MDKGRWQDMCTITDNCALTGTAAFFSGIPDAVLVANGPLWCYYYSLHYLERQIDSVSARFYCTQADNDAVVYGTEELLLDCLQTIRASGAKPSLLMVMNNCSVGLIGDDIAGIVRQASPECPVVCLDSGGLIGGFAAGYRAAVRAYLEQQPPAKRAAVLPRTVNLLGCTTGYYNWANDLNELKRMLALIGFAVLACPGAGSNLAEIDAMTRAEFNLVIHPELGLDMAERLEQDYGMPFLALPLPYGIEGSLNWLKAVQRQAGVQTSAAVPDQEADHLRRQIQWATGDMERIWGELWFDKTVVAGPPSIALGVAAMLRREWADTGELTAVIDDRDKIAVASDEVDQILYWQTDSERIRQQLGQLSGGLLLAGSSEQAAAERSLAKKFVSLNITLPVMNEVLLSSRPYMGLQGSLCFGEQLWNQTIRLRQQNGCLR